MLKQPAGVAECPHDVIVLTLLVAENFVFSRLSTRTGGHEKNGEEVGIA